MVCKRNYVVFIEYMQSFDQKSVTLVKTIGLLKSAEGRFWTLSYNVYFTSVSTQCTSANFSAPICIHSVQLWLLAFLISYSQSIPKNTAQSGVCAVKPHTLTMSAVSINNTSRIGLNSCSLSSSTSMSNYGFMFK